MTTEPSAGLTPAELEEIERREKSATPGPWHWYNGCSWWRLGVADNQSKHDSVLCPTIDRDGHPNMSVRGDNRDFIAHARTDIPALLAEVRRLQAQLDSERKSITDIMQAVQDGGAAVKFSGRSGYWLENPRAERAEAELQRVGGEWIPVGERLPDNTNDVLVCGKHSGTRILRYVAATEGWWADDEFPEAPPDYWRPLPAPPKDEGKGE